MANLAKTYNPKEFEDRIYDMWERKGTFNADIDKNKKPFTIVMPPPNITGKLHMGHALDHTLQDILTRWKRMQGYSALWLPGSDHASIATEVKVVEKIKNEQGKDKHDMTREEFLEHAWQWKEEYVGRITNQCRKLGDSCDWRRERFTMDEGCNKAVNEMFISLYNKGLIYKGDRIINWCPSCETTLSDAEVEHEDMDGNYWYFRYPAEDGSEGIVIATSRPETMFADVAIAVSADDERYKNLIGKNVILPIVGRKIPVITDEHADPDKGTGAVKITPAHDMNDFEVGQRHNLDSSLSCINEKAEMTELAGKYQGMDRYDCRKAWVAELKENGYLVKVENLTIPVGKCYRCNTVVEPRISDQWFVAMKTLAEPAIKAVQSEGGELSYVPKRFEKIHLSWLNGIRDWCISRQLWWGHRIPAYYCDECGEIMVQAEAPDRCSKCGSPNISQDEDVLDTWFSSALWPFSTLGWPEKTPELNYFYPNSVMVTGYDIIFFWVIRMVFSGLYAMDEIPFKHVFIHGLVRDEKGRKMSKSLGNGVDPLEVIDTYGADALRFMLATGITPGNDMRFLTARLESSRNFANKLWNASRFTIMNLIDDNGDFLPMADDATAVLRDEDKWIISVISDGVKEITDDLDKFDIGIAGQKIYELIWDVYCDWYIELIKPRLYGNDDEDKKTARYVLQKTLKILLKLLHPYMPFITEEIWGYLPKKSKTEDNPDGLLIKEGWPVYYASLEYDESVRRIEIAKAIIKAVRNIRVEADAAPSRHLNLIIKTDVLTDVIPHIKSYISNMANVDSIHLINSEDDTPDDVITSVIDGGEILVAMDELVDTDAEIARLEKEKTNLESEVVRVQKKLENQGFVSKAPAQLVEEEKAKGEKYKDMLDTVNARLEQLYAKKK